LTSDMERDLLVMVCSKTTLFVFYNSHKVQKKVDSTFYLYSNRDADGEGEQKI
jgi:hypothetical protein